MKYSDKFPSMEYIDDVCESVMRGRTAQPCIICGSPTEYIEINYEARLCSEECVVEMDKRAHEAILRSEAACGELQIEL